MKKKSKLKPYITSFVTAGVVAVVYTSIFPLYRPLDYLICGALALLLGRVVYIMASGLDTSKKAPVQRTVPVTGNQAVDNLVQQGQKMLADIREENDGIPDPVLSAKIDQLDEITNKIFLTVVDKPEKAPQIRRFMEYYLPTVLKMLTNYRKLDERNVTGENSAKMKKRVEEAMDVVIGAFEKQHDQLYQNDMLDVTTDIDVLETMLKQDGLIDSGLHDNKAGQTMSAGT
ncbi:MAG: 5-bromo-4-chloroindolyl phosphate hydrolysis family protein [Clostridia bacterium]|nr:5-bromo-4-chloroindolyl phosphate hydrolysis family protein [Clostridia bacterium]